MQRGQRSAQPACDGDAESLLGTSQDRRRQPARRGPLEQSLGLVSAELERWRQGLDEIDQLRVQERSADLEAAGHAGPIDLGEDVLGEVRVLVEGQRAGQRIGAAAEQTGAAGGARARCRSDRRRPELGDLRAGKRAQPALMCQGERLGRAAEKLLELEVEAEIAMVDRQPPDGRAGQCLSRTGQPAEHSGGSLGGEGRIAGQELVGAVAAQDDLHLAAREPAQEMVGRIDASPNGSSSQRATCGRSS